MTSLETKALTWLKSAYKYFSLTPDLLDQAQAEAEIRAGVSFRGTNILILMFAIMIASLGLNTNSPAVIIGAMLISPLMGPIVGIGLAVGVEDFELLKRSARNLVVASAVSVAVSTIYFLISPVREGHSELLARTSPTIYDVMIGFFGGAAGIVALGSKSRGNVIPGVAIATALMPPLCTAGYGLATWQMNYFFGAFYLFIINSIFIGFATYIGVKLLRWHNVEVANPQRAHRMKRAVYIVAILTMLPSIYITYEMLRDTRFQINASKFVQEEFQFPMTSVIRSKAYVEQGQQYIDVTLIGRILPEDSLKLALASKLKFFGLEDAKLNIIQGDAPEASQSVALSSQQIYDLAQTSLSAKQNVIDSLRTVLAARQMADSISARIIPELQVIFPAVQEIAVQRAVFAEAGTRGLDTVNVALVRYATPPPESRRLELERYLSARLRMKNVKIVDVSPQIIEGN